MRGRCGPAPAGPDVSAHDALRRRHRLQDEDVGKLVSHFLRTQKEDVRNVFIRKYFYFDSIGEIAERFGFTKSKVKNMLFYTRNKLRDYLIKEGVEI